MIARTGAGPEIERVTPMPLRTQLEFLEIVQKETNVQGRRMLSYWATPSDVAAVGSLLDLDADRRLDATLKLMWRTPSE